MIFKNNCFIAFFLIGTFTCGSLIQTESAITYLDKSDWKSRLGDTLMMYIKAKWLSYRYNLPLLYKPFPYSDQLQLHVKERQFNKDMLKNYKKKIMCRDAPASLENYIIPQENNLYTVHYYFSLPHWGRDYQKKYDSLEVSTWKEICDDQEFLNEIRINIAPRNNIKIFDPPIDKVTVAVHIRMGGGFDIPLLSRQLYNPDELDADEQTPEGKFADQYWPLKFPPLQYYIDQIKRLSQMLNDPEMFVYIYTDHQDPVVLTNSIEAAINKKNITLDCRKKHNHHSQNVLEDMFSMANYDYLIRSASNFPQISQLLGKHKVVIYPKSCKWIGNAMVIDEVGTYFMNNENRLSLFFTEK